MLFSTQSFQRSQSSVIIITFSCVLLLFIVSATFGMQRQQNPGRYFYYAYDTRISLTPLADNAVIRLVETSDITTLLRESSLNPDVYEIETLDPLTFKIQSDARNITRLLNIMKDNPTVHTVQPVYTLNSGLEMGITDEICVEFKRGVSKRRQRRLHRSLAVSVKESKKYYDILSVAIHGDALAIANRYQESGLVKYAHPNFLSKVETLGYIPNDEFFNKQFALHNTGQTLNDGHVGTVDADVDAPEAWNITKGSPNIVIAIIDEGVTLNHPDLDANIWQNFGEIPDNNIDDDGNGYVDDVNGWDFLENDNDPSPIGNGAHGTACAGIVAAEQDNNEGITGIAPYCRIMPLRIVPIFLGYLTPFGIFADAIDYAWENGADILSNSWGFPDTNPNLSPVIKEAIKRATTLGRGGLGSVVCFAAGNTANHVNNEPGFVSFPSNVDVPGVVTIAASNRDDFQSNYSPTSALIDISAPSHNAYYSQIPGESFEIWTTDIGWVLGYNIGKNDPHISEYLPDSGTNFLEYTGRFGGTSAACPLVAGIAGLVLSVKPSLTQLDVFDILTSTADKIGSYNYVNGRSEETGYGRVNAAQAVIKANSTNLTIGDIDILCCVPIPDPGGPVVFRFRIRNLTRDRVTVRRSVELLRPDGRTEQILTPRSRVLPPRQRRREVRRFRVPASHPAGRYQLTLLWDEGISQQSVSVDFEKLSSRAKIAADNNDLIPSTEFVPETMTLEQNYPNPFNPSTMISYGLDQDAQITLKIYNVLGQEVVTLVDGFESAGIHSLFWNGIDSKGHAVAAGVYIFQMIAHSDFANGENSKPFVQTRKMFLAK